MAKKSKFIYCLKKDGKMLVNTHFFVYENEYSSILTFLLFSLNMRCKDLNMVQVGVIKDDGVNDAVHFFYDDYRIVCNYSNCIEQLVLHVSNHPKKDEIISYANELKNDIEKRYNEERFQEPSEIKE